MSIMGNGSAEIDPALWSRAATRVAEELRLDPSQDRTAKVSSLLHMFRGQGIHCDIEDMMRALQAHGVTARARGSEISRRDVLDFCLTDGISSEARLPRPTPGTRVSHWRAGEAGQVQPLEEARALSETVVDVVRWFDVDPRGGEPSIDAVNEVTEQLRPWCPGLNRTIVRDLLTPDSQPKSEIYGDERTGIRTVSVPALVSRGVSDDDDDFDGVDEQLVVQIVELVVGPGWMITCWHPARTLLGGGVAREGPSLLQEPFPTHVAHRWVHDIADVTDSGSAKGAGDLAIYLARTLVATFDTSLRMLQRWVSSWEVAFYQAIGGRTVRGLAEGSH